MCFKQLNLDQSKFRKCINEFFGDKESIIDQVSSSLHQIKRNVDGEEMLLNIYLLNDGRTTLTYKVGKNQNLSKKLAEYIKENTLVDSRPNICLSFREFSKESLCEMIEYLTTDPNVEVLDDRTVQSGQRVIKFKGHQNDIVTVTYHTTSTLLLQGRPVTLYCQIIAFLTEYLSLGEVIESQSKFIKIPIKISDIQSELTSRLPYSFEKIDETTRKMIGASIAFTKLDIELPDYTAFVFPSLRALEGQIKCLFLSKGIHITNKDGFKGFFELKGNQFKLNSNGVSSINCSKTCFAIEKAYNYYINHRHSLFHAESIPLGSTIIEDRNDAVKIIETVIKIFEEIYQIIK